MREFLPPQVVTAGQPCTMLPRGVAWRPAARCWTTEPTWKPDPWMAARRFTTLIEQVGNEWKWWWHWWHLVTNEAKNTWHTCEKGSHQKNKNRMQEKMCCVFRWCFTLETAKSRRMEWIPIDWRCFQIIMLRSRSRVGNLWKFGGLKIQDVWSDWLLNI